MSSKYTRMFTRYDGKIPLLSVLIANTFRSSFSSKSSSCSFAPNVLPAHNKVAAVFIYWIMTRFNFSDRTWLFTKVSTDINDSDFESVSS